MQIALIHRRTMLRIRIEQFLDVSLRIVADPNAPDQALVFRFFQGLPTFESLTFATIRTVDEVQIDVAQSTFRQRLLDAFLGRIVPVVVLKFGTVEDVGALDWTIGGGEVARDGATDALFVVVPFRTVATQEHISPPPKQSERADFCQLAQFTPFCGRSREAK